VVHPFAELPSKICSKPIDLSVDPCVDETGSAVHFTCYVKSIADSSDSAAVRFLIAQWREYKDRAIELGGVK